MTTKHLVLLFFFASVFSLGKAFAQEAEEDLLGENAHGEMSTTEECWWIVQDSRRSGKDEVEEFSEDNSDREGGKTRGI